MRSNGIEGCNASNPIVQGWADNPRVTDDLLLTAASMAKAREVLRPGPKYLAPIVEQLLAPKPAKPKADAWWATNETMRAKAREIGIADARPGEEPSAFRSRIQQALNAKEPA